MSPEYERILNWLALRGIEKVRYVGTNQRDETVGLAAHRADTLRDIIITSLEDGSLPHQVEAMWLDTDNVLHIQWRVRREPTRRERRK